MFTFDKVFDERATTKQIYDFAAHEIVTSAVEGRNGSIFAYGQTSSGKTYTMQGSSTISKGAGMGNAGKKGSGAGLSNGFVHLTAVDLFNEIAEIHGRDYKIQVSVIEVYNEEVRDMLVDKKKNKSNLLKIRENSQRGIYVDAAKMEAKSLNDLLKILSMGEKNRIVAKTTLNKRSSRSHLIFSIGMESKPNSKDTKSKHLSPEEMQTSTFSTLNLIDLAGSESVRHRSAHSNNTRLTEGGNINKSLLTLSRVITALGEPQSSSTPTHIGYRDSKLTRVLQPTLSGNAKLAFVCCVTASGLFLEETKSTLKFAQRIKHVKTTSKINLKAANKSDIIKRMQEDLDDTKRSLSESMDRVRALENQNKGLKATIQFLTEDRDRALEKIKAYEEMKSKDKGSVKRHSTILDSNNIVQSNGELMALNEANNDMEDQVGFLSRVVGKLQGKTNSESDSRINGLPANIRAQSGGMVSVVTEASRYGSHVDELDSLNGSIVSLDETSSSSLLSEIKGEFVVNSLTNIVPEENFA